MLYITVDSTRGTGSVSWQVSIVGLYFTNCIECCFIRECCTLQLTQSGGLVVSVDRLVSWVRILPIVLNIV